ncbi:MAG TPA: OmpA family protein, partial [Roseiflexaceae bacterium]|nr:OmpA family protein [Roseiflexaceae bacterium]
VVTLREAAFFAPGDDDVSSEALPTIREIASAIKQLPNPVRFEGHTDSVPINNERFRSNWELSAARSIAVMELLATEFAVSRSKMAIAGYAETVPVSSNETEEGRARNRRVEIKIIPFTEADVRAAQAQQGN